MGDSAPNITDDRQRFVALAQEIIERIEETREPGWWWDIRELVRELERTRRRLEGNDPRRAFPGFFIVDVFRGKPDERDAEFVGSFSSPGFKEVIAGGFMLSRDPLLGTRSFAWLWSEMPYDVSKEIVDLDELYPMRYQRGTRDKALKVLRRWIRAVREGMIDIRNGDENGAPTAPLMPTRTAPADEARPAIDSVEASPVALEVLPANEPTVMQVNDKPRVGYLGLLFDDARRRVGRAGFTETIELSQLLWGILKALSKSGDTPVAVERLKAVWEADGIARNPSDGTVVDAISELRKRITTLRLTIQSKRKLGYTLCEIANRRRPSSPAPQLKSKSYYQRKASSRPKSKGRDRTLRS
jgi:hypothetical protein